MALKTRAVMLQERTIKLLRKYREYNRESNNKILFRLLRELLKDERFTEKLEKK